MFFVRDIAMKRCFNLSDILKIKNIKIRYINYKYRVLLCLIILVGVAVGLFGAYYFRSAYNRRAIRAAQLSDSSLEQVIGLVSDQLDSVYNYYLVFADKSEVTYITNNDVDYSQYSHIDDARTSLAGNNIVSDYINGYSFINYSTKWILSSKGMYKFDETSNIDVLQTIYDDVNESSSRILWKSIEADEPDNLDRQYRTTVSLDGLDLIMGLPRGMKDFNAVLIVNIDINAIGSFAKDSIVDGQELVITNNLGSVVYATNKLLASNLAETLSYNKSDSKLNTMNYDNEKYYVSVGDYQVPGLNFYVATRGDYFENISYSYTFFMIVVIILLSALLAYLGFRWIYKPVDTMVHKISEGNTNKLKPGEDELTYVANSLKELSGNNVVLQKGVTQLFQRRILQGELSDEEIDDYLEKLVQRDRFNYYIAISFILRASNDELNISSADEKKILRSLSEFIFDRFGKYLILEPCYYARAVFCLVDLNNEDGNIISLIYNCVREYIEQLMQGLLIGAGVSDIHNNKHELYNCYQESVLALNTENNVTDHMQQGFELQESYIRSYKQSENNKGVTFEKDFEEHIYHAIVEGDKEKAYEITNDFIRNLGSHGYSHEENLIFLVQYINTIVIAARELGYHNDSVFKEGISDIYQNIIHSYDLSNTRKYIKRTMIDPLIEQNFSNSSAKTGLLIESVAELIKQKEGDISLSECARSLGYHPTYLWKVLKQERNMTFSDLIEEYKLVTAKKLLLNKDLTVAQIAAKLNYTNTQNFIRFFNKKEGVTPGKYRQEYLAK